MRERDIQNVLRELQDQGGDPVSYHIYVVKEFTFHSYG